MVAFLQVNEDGFIAARNLGHMKLIAQLRQTTLFLKNTNPQVYQRSPNARSKRSNDSEALEPWALTLRFRLAPSHRFEG